MDLSAGTSTTEGHSMLCGRFELMREEPANTGVQLFGPTLAVLDTHTGEPARACVLDAALLPTPADRAAFVRALGELADLQEPALVPQVFVGEDGERVVVCYDPLQGALALRDIDDGPRSSDLANELRRLARQLAGALAALHARGRVHGMLACEAVFVGPHGPAAFQHGFAPLCARAELERRWSSIDPSRLAPEVIAGGGFTPAADTYAWGVALAEFATGLRGSAALRAPEPPGLPDGVWALITASMASDPASRPRDGAELVRRLDALAGPAEPAEAPVVSLLSPPATEPPAPAPESPVSEALSDSPGPLEPAPSVSTSSSRAAPVELADVPVTSLEELLINEGSFRPNTVAALRPVVAPPPVPPPASSSSSAAAAASAISGVQAQESGSRATSGDPPGRSHSGLRRVHVLTEDSIVRRPPSSRPDLLSVPDEPGSGESTPPSSGSDPRQIAAITEAPATPRAKSGAHSAPSPMKHSPSRPSPVKAPEATAPKSSDRSFWIVMAALVLAVILAWAFT